MLGGAARLAGTEAINAFGQLNPVPSSNERTSTTRTSDVA
jgi:hypothetical protein